MDTPTIIALILFVLGIVALFYSQKKIASVSKYAWAVVFIAGAIILLNSTSGGIGSALKSFSIGGEGTSVVTSGVASGGVGFYQPTASYSAKDKFSTSTITGTAYYKVGDNPATTTAYTNVNAGDTVTYWMSNGTFYSAPVTKVAGTGVNAFNAVGYNNATATVTLYDLANRASVTSGAYNTSMGANKQASIEITYQGTAKKSSAPFGGVMVVEANSSIPTVTCTGDDLLSSNPFTVTYAPTSTTTSYRVFAFGTSLDDGTGSVKRINCQFQNGASQAGAGAPFYVKFIPANYYVTQDGRILLDVEKVADQDTTRTQIANTISVTGYWGA